MSIQYFSIISRQIPSFHETICRRNLLKNQIRFNIIHNKQNSGKGFSIRKAIKFASKDNIILIDGDLELDIEHIPNILKKYEKEVDGWLAEMPIRKKRCLVRLAGLG